MFSSSKFPNPRHSWRWLAGLVSFLLAASASLSLAAGITSVNSVASLRTAVAQAKAGTVIEVADGEYNLETPVIISPKGTESAPVVIRAAHVGQAKTTGKAGFVLDQAEWLTVEGFVLANKVSLFKVKDCHQVRLSRLSFAYAEPLDAGGKPLGGHWLMLSGGQSNRVDHCEFGYRKGHGVTLVVAQPEQHFQIDHNHFAGRPPGDDNGCETIRLGTGGRDKFYGLVESNLFENCDGDAEVISVKTSNNTVRYNTVWNSQGQIVVRSGNNVDLIGNCIFGDGRKKSVGGFRLHGEDIRVIKNHLQGLTGRALVTVWGDHTVAAVAKDFDDRPREVFEQHYRQTRRAVIFSNLFVDCRSAINVGEKTVNRGCPMSLPPDGWLLADNVFVGDSPGPLVAGSGEENFKWTGNIAFRRTGPLEIGRDLKTDALRIADPQLERKNSLWQFPRNSPKSSERVQGVAADFLDVAIPARPLTAAEVGPAAK